MQKIKISQKASDKKGNLRMPENIGFRASKRKSFSDSYIHFDRKDDYFIGSGKTLTP